MSLKQLKKEITKIADGAINEGKSKKDLMPFIRATKEIMALGIHIQAQVKRLAKQHNKLQDKHSLDK